MIKKALLIGIVLALGASAWSLAGWRDVYYQAMESFGIHKRDLLVTNVAEARDSQERTKEQFQSALEKFSTLVRFDGGKLQEAYTQLQSEFDRSRALADKVRQRIDSVEAVASDLFTEWEAELERYSNVELRRGSGLRLERTRRRCERLVESMRLAEARMVPVLGSFQDQVLFLKHNLNARAISSLQGEIVTMEADISALIRDMEASIRQADEFIDAMGVSKSASARGAEKGRT